MAEQYCLKWNNHQTTLVSVFTSLLDSGNLSDCILSAEGESLQAHQVVISACSPYLDKLLNANRTSNQFGVPILIFNDLKIDELRAMREYMYKGEVNIAQENLNSFLRAAQALQIKGLAEQSGNNSDRSADRGLGGQPFAKRRRRRTRDDCDSESSGCDSGMPSAPVVPPVQTEMKEEGPSFAGSIKAEPPDPGQPPTSKQEPLQDLTVEDEEYDTADYAHDNSHDISNWQMDGSMNSEDFGPEHSQNTSATQPNSQGNKIGIIKSACSLHIPPFVKKKIATCQAAMKAQNRTTTVGQLSNMAPGVTNSTNLIIKACPSKLLPQTTTTVNVTCENKSIEQKKPPAVDNKITEKNSGCSSDTQIKKPQKIMLIKSSMRSMYKRKGCPEVPVITDVKTIANKITKTFSSQPMQQPQVEVNKPCESKLIEPTMPPTIDKKITDPAANLPNSKTPYDPTLDKNSVDSDTKYNPQVADDEFLAFLKKTAMENADTLDPVSDANYVDDISIASSDPPSEGDKRIEEPVEIEEEICDQCFQVIGEVHCCNGSSFSELTIVENDSWRRLSHPVPKENVPVDPLSVNKQVQVSDPMYLDSPVSPDEIPPDVSHPVPIVPTVASDDKPLDKEKNGCFLSEDPDFALSDNEIYVSSDDSNYEPPKKKSNAKKEPKVKKKPLPKFAIVRNDKAKWTSGTILECPSCKMEFTHPKAFSNHGMLAHGSCFSYFAIKCTECGFLTPDLSELSSHYSKEHRPPQGPKLKCFFCTYSPESGPNEQDVLRVHILHNHQKLIKKFIYHDHSNTPKIPKKPAKPRKKLPPPEVIEELLAKKKSTKPAIIARRQSR